MTDDCFSDPNTMREVLEEFLPGDWLEHADFRTLERVLCRAPSSRRHPHHDDAVWRLRIAGDWLYVCVLFKFTQPDRWMPLRALARVGLLFQKLMMERKLPPDGRFPPMLPIVLCGADRQWIGTPDLPHLLPPTPQKLAASGALFAPILPTEPHRRRGAPCPTIAKSWPPST